MFNYYRFRHKPWSSTSMFFIIHVIRSAPVNKVNKLSGQSIGYSNLINHLPAISASSWSPSDNACICLDQSAPKGLTLQRSWKNQHQLWIDHTFTEIDRTYFFNLSNIQVLLIQLNLPVFNIILNFNNTDVRDKATSSNLMVKLMTRQKLNDKVWYIEFMVIIHVANGFCGP